MKKKGLSIALAALMSVAAVSAFAGSTVNAVTGTPYTALDVSSSTTNHTTTFDKYLVMKNNASVPNCEFLYTVTAGTPVAANTGTLAVLAGNNAENIKIYSVTDSDTTKNELTFSTADTTTSEASAASTDTAVFVTPSATDEKFVKKTLTVDLSGVTFTEPGVYRYIITENTGIQGVTSGYEGEGNTAIITRTLDVYVKDATDSIGKKLEIENYVMYKDTVTGAPNINKTASSETTVPNGAEVAGATKSRSITNKYSTQDLTFGKIVTGNQGSKDKYFKFTVVIDNITAKDAEFNVELSADAAVPASDSLNVATLAAYAGKTNPSTLLATTGKTIAADGYVVEASTTTPVTYKITAEYYLQHGQYITIKGLPTDATYAVTEANEDYAQTAGIAQTLSTLDWDGASGVDALSDNTSGTIQSADIHTGYTNDRSGTIPTGVILSVAAPAGIGVAVVGGIIYLIAKRRKDENEDDE